MSELCPHGKHKMKDVERYLNTIEHDLMYFIGYTYSEPSSRKYAEEALAALERIREAIQ